MNILITGSTGVIGCRFVPYLIEQNHHLLLLVRNVQKAKVFFERIISKDIELMSWDELGSEKIKRFQPETVFHLAGYSTSQDDIDSMENLISSNILSGTRLLHYITQVSSVKYFINIGSSTEYYNNSEAPNPTYLYSATKTAFRSILSYYVSKNDMKVVHVILYSVYGMKSGQKRIMDYLLNGIDSKNPVSVSPGEQHVDFIHIVDVISGFKALLDNLDQIKKKEILFYLGSGKSHTIKEVAAIIEQVTNNKLNLNWGGVSYRDRDMMLSKAPLNKNSITWKPSISLESGIEQYTKLVR